MVVARIHTVETESETHHVEVVLREMLNTCRVADVTDNLVTVRSLEVFRSLIEELELLFAEGIELVVVATHEMGENAARNYCRLTLQTTDEPWHVLLWIEAQAVHARVEFDMNWELRDSFLFGLTNQCFENVEVEDFRFESVVEKELEGSHFGIHHHDVGSDARLAQFGSFVGDSHSEVVHSVVLKRFRCLDGSDAVG